MIPSEPTATDLQPPFPGPSAGRACGVGVLAVGLVTAAAAAVGLPAGTAPFVALGSGVACLAGSLGCLMHLRAARSPGGSSKSAWQFRSALVLDFLFKLLGLAAGVGILWLAGVKFDGIAGFGLSFAGASMAFQLVSSVTLARGWARRTRALRSGRTETDESPDEEPLKRLPAAD